MCTAVSYKTSAHYFGRTLDLEYSYGEQVVVMPRRHPVIFRCGYKTDNHPAVIGMATVVGGYPLYYDGTNEHGLSVAALNFPRSAYYPEPAADGTNVAPFEVIPWILTRCASVDEAVTLMQGTRVAAINFSADLPASPVHWIVADKHRSVVMEPMPAGLKITDDPVGVMTNEPPIEFHLDNLVRYMNLSPDEPSRGFAEDANLASYAAGMGAVGLPGDFSSPSRFVKAAFCKLNSVSDGSEGDGVAQFFHIMASVAMPRGCVRLANGAIDITVYTSCCNTDTGVYYYTTYGNSQVTAVDMHRADLDGADIICYPLVTEMQVNFSQPF